MYRASELRCCRRQEAREGEWHRKSDKSLSSSAELSLNLTEAKGNATERNGKTRTTGRREGKGCLASWTTWKALRHRRVEGADREGGGGWTERASLEGRKRKEGQRVADLAIVRGSGGREEWGGPGPGWSTGPKHVPRKENEEEGD